MANEDLLRLTIQLSPEHARNLILWAKWHGKPKTAFAGQIVASRIESNLDTINKLVEEAAKARGITPEELKQQWLAEEGRAMIEGD